MGRREGRKEEEEEEEEGGEKWSKMAESCVLDSKKLGDGCNGLRIFAT